MDLYQPGDEIKVKFQFKQSGESEWLWFIVTYADGERRFVFCYLDSEPKINTDKRFGMELVISYDNIKDHIKVSSLTSPCP